MSPEEKKRMLHIRLDSEIHKDLRKAAAEYDISIQEIVADAVEKEVELLETEVRLEKRRSKLEKKAMEYELEIIERAETDLDREIEPIEQTTNVSTEMSASISDRLECVELAIFKMSQQIDEIKSLLVNND